MAKKSKTQSEEVEEKKTQDSPDLLGIDYFRLLYVAIGFLVLALLVTYLVIDDDSIKVISQ